MENSEVKFSSYRLIVNDEEPIKNDFSEFEENFLYTYKNKEATIYHSIITECNDKYFWLSSSFGREKPHPKNVLNINNKLHEKNPRNEYQIEQKEQLFLLYSFEFQTLYVSNAKMKSFIEYLLNDKTNKNIVIKDYFKDIDEFYSLIKSINEIKFTSIRQDLLTKNGGIQSSLIDNYGMEEPTEFTIEAKYKIPLNNRLKNSIAFLRKDKESGFLKKLIIQGLDDNGFSKIFNEDSFIEKFLISTSKNNDGLLDIEDVKQKIINKLGLI